MSRPKVLLKSERAKKKSARSEALQDADDILAEGVELEEAGEKWRGGDAVKSMRFFRRALDMYSQGLMKFPQNLDLAYNKARIQFEIASHPVLVKQLRVPLLTALNEALLSHQYALQLDQDNPDSLFNTGQVLTSIAEEIAKDDRRSEREAVQLLEQALELLQRCLTVQEYRYEENQRQIEAAMAAANDPSPPAPHASREEAVEDMITQGEGSPRSPAQEQWASIVEPITKNSLLDTALAQIYALTTLSGLLSQANTSILPTVEQLVTELLTIKIPAFLDGEERAFEVALAKGNLLSGLLEANFRSSRIDVQTYKQERDTAFSDPALSFSTFPAASASIADANSLISFNSALTDIIPSSHHEYSTTLPLRWQSLSAATDTLTKTVKTPGIDLDDLVQTHYLRGDIALLQHRMGQAPASYPTASKSAAILLKNAVTFYKNAVKLSLSQQQQNGDDVTLTMEAKVKGLVAEAMQSATAADGGAIHHDGPAKELAEGLKGLKGLKGEVVKGILIDMADEQLVGQEVVEPIWASLQ